ncbi:LysR family transcriptional regulator [Mesorhizobium sp. M4B.F.Ca.ET.169.01.1.1]|uniref:LysR family transcriptional regulator n=1 Tax=unclassified Mesorhizobium TaxID=325217 RepID=UPI000FCABEAD|nr:MULTISPECIES: LysR family transcriptional regulator [unclassified Mesorhizobium]RVD46091.1 LysR family transcriptional regulator [Mesorhizobium sp. M4B.F.Ca.ET.019.03.1.1]TGT41913.1 LysR family transcriptional regulator [Mesorhizobium sp. M4B.F.Ca.ET.169.01.1.1]
MQRRIQLITLDCALVVTEEGSFLGASRRMGIHHSALSRRIRDLEHSLGMVLFERHTGGVRPTLTGARLLGNLRRVLTELDGALAGVETDRRGQAGSLSIDSDPFLHATEFLDAVTDFIRNRPDVAIYFMETKRGSFRSP